MSNESETAACAHSDIPSRLFAYGTLMCADILYEVAGIRRPPVPARLEDFRRRGVSGEDYPAIVPEPGHRVHGVLYDKLSPNSWTRLDRFEGDMYVRMNVTIALPDGRQVVADAYVARPEFHQALDEADWDFSDFLRHGKKRFQAAYRGYEDL